jgi:hypothetical protein
MGEYFVGVKLIFDDELKPKSNLQIVYEGEDKILTSEQTISMLTGGITLLLNGIGKGVIKTKSGKKDYEILKGVIDHLTSEFVNVESFNDLFVNGKMGKDTEE